jgi:hypothetical protein
VHARPPIEPAFVRAVRRFAAAGLTYAEIERALQPLTAVVGMPAPSYSAVRRIAAPRPKERQPNPYLQELVEKLLTGRLPDFYRVDAMLGLEAPSGPGEALGRLVSPRRGPPV